jgi:vacuolar ATPase assembly integral membrane protein VMA21
VIQQVLKCITGNSTFAGATAAIMANVVLVAYVVVAMREDQSETLAAAEEKKKAR